MDNTYDHTPRQASDDLIVDILISMVVLLMMVVAAWPFPSWHFTR